MSGIIPVQKWGRALSIISFNGGLIGSLLKLWRTDTLKLGKLVGTDSFGNKYYHSNYYPFIRSRWVEFNPTVKWDYDASQVTAEWFGWLHFKTDNLPCHDPAKKMLSKCFWSKKWLMPHAEQLSGTKLAYYPYSTTNSHINITEWDAKWGMIDSAHTQCDCGAPEQSMSNLSVLNVRRDVVPTLYNRLEKKKKKELK